MGVLKAERVEQITDDRRVPDGVWCDCGWWQLRVPVTRQVDQDEFVLARKEGNDGAPSGSRAAGAMDQNEGLAISVRSQLRP